MIVRKVGRVDYQDALEAMRKFTAARAEDTPDELWVLEHPPVYTLGQGADPAHAPQADTGIPVVRVERGGEVTYHGPGQVVVYTLVDLARLGIKVREFVQLLEQCVIDLLAAHGVAAERKPGAPGVYVKGAKVAALGIRVTRGRALHGLALNVDMELAPFGAINPCGYPGLAVTQTRDLGIAAGTDELGIELARRIARQLEMHYA
ncbi:MAG: lipoyl(octanoyl) transferase LipB [Proteobacteria bacterium]|nr:lipoyl(octanoyl) transferase LipB [Pseudomonadota bacterium]